ncbi:MAG: large conductance mechanosensitive channel protein MscL [Cryobacterium sp.]|nr:large conductance mechanosensitive channel protein MscL [Oligoflexia bacterium]
MFKEFRTFLMRGNIVDLAVAVIIGGAFTKVVTSLTSDVIMPLVGQAAGKMDFANLFIDLSGNHFQTLDEAKKAGAATINIGVFVNQLIDFLIVAFVVYMILKTMNRAMGRKGPIEAPK